VDHGKKAIVAIRRACSEEIERIVTFYHHDNDYKPTIGPSDVIIVAENKEVLCGVVRLCKENEVLVLRGMRVGDGMRKQGIGTGLLEAVEAVINERECFCIPHRYLCSFYGHIGFRKIETSEAPSFLRERCAEYRHKYGLDVIIMRRSNPPDG
jgi:N-acetylglutamate synthase-like GNAT family acetyltransferase